MILFKSLSSKISEHFNNSSPSEALNVYGLSSEQVLLALSNWLDNGLLKHSEILFVLPTLDDAEDFFSICKDSFPDVESLFFPGLGQNPYYGHYCSERNTFDRFYTIGHILNNKNFKFIITHKEALFLKLPPKSFFLENSFKINVSDIIDPYSLSDKLVELGYQSSLSIEEQGTFSKKGEIFDIFPLGGTPCRIHYFDEMIEEIYEVNPENQRTLKDSPLGSIDIFPCPASVLSKDNITNFRENIPTPTPQFKDRFANRKRIIEEINNGHLFDNYSLFISSFFSSHSFLSDFFAPDCLTINLNSFSSNQELVDISNSLPESFDSYIQDIDNNSIFPPLNLLYDFNNFKNINSINIDNVKIDLNLDSNLSDTEIFLGSAINHINANIEVYSNKQEFLSYSVKYLRHLLLKRYTVIFLYHSTNAQKEFLNLSSIYNLDEFLNKTLILQKSDILKNGFFYENEKILYLTEGDLFSHKKKVVKKSQTQDYDLFAEQISTLKVGDYVIHSEHGVGKYEGIQNLSIGASPADFLVISYTENDKVYLPVYKINLIQKHADSAANIKTESLRNNKFNLVKARARESAKKLAIDLLKLQAQREQSEAFSFSEPDSYYRDFELDFSFQETPDQSRAIEEVIESMQKNKPMDYLVCGDVGFGKTEVAMRAAFKAVQDHKQVAVLVPTTILALQHYNSFVKRFKNFPVNIDFVSRFKSAKDSSLIYSKLAEGEIDIIVGTHKLLSDKIKYKDLGLVIVDEEQRFGVGHKEKLKSMKASVDFLTLTATPIPRTLQLCFLGLREMSLIKTAPPKRQSIKSYLIKDDNYTLQQAILKELNRGGQVFIVHNRVQDIEQFSARIRDLVPNASIVIGHGQLPERELENRMKDFYDGKYQILIATTIIESGIDIPNANTMIIDRADTFGLSQLHQLRGRIGRSDKKAYAYFVIPNNRSINPIAEKRLKALQTYADMGSGFNIANCDLEIRGAGDILGAEQSGHLESVGLELYMELLQEAIQDLKGERVIHNRNIEISTPWNAAISKDFIDNSSERLKLYKRLSNATTLTKLELLVEEIQDLYGLPDESFFNLITILKTRLVLQNTGIIHIQVSTSTISLKFDKQILANFPELQEKVLKTFISRPKVYQFSPDYKVLYSSKAEVTPDYLYQFSQDIAEQIVPC